MPSNERTIEHPEIFGVSETSITLTFSVHEDGTAVDAEAAVRIDGDLRTVSSGAGETGAGTRLLRIEDLAPDREYAIEIRAEGGATARPGRYFSGVVRTLPAPRSEEVASFATLNDLHFGEARIGGTLTEDHEYGQEAEGFPAVCDRDYDAPYSEFMSEDAVAAINQLGVGLTIVKGDIADRGLPEQFETAARIFGRLEKPHHAFLGNHDYLEHAQGRAVDAYALLGQEPAPRVVELSGWKLVLLDTTIPGRHEGSFGALRREWLADVLAMGRGNNTPTLLFTHHQPVPPEHRKSYPNSIGMDSEDSLALFGLLGDAPHVRGVLIGHTHRNRVRRYPAAGDIPFAEVNNPKDYPGGFGHYRLFADGSFRQEVRRTPSARALTHSTRCRGLFGGGYQHFTMGTLEERSFVAEP